MVVKLFEMLLICSGRKSCRGILRKASGEHRKGLVWARGRQKMDTVSV
jgi:hypothetical protein